MGIERSPDDGLAASWLRGVSEVPVLVGLARPRGTCCWFWSLDAEEEGSKDPDCKPSQVQGVCKGEGARLRLTGCGEEAALGWTESRNELNESVSFLLRSPPDILELLVRVKSSRSESTFRFNPLERLVAST